MLGCLVEKQLTTPQQYPLTLNALTAATNQATNRDPVVELGDDTVLAAVDELRSIHLVRVVLPSHGRSVKRYRHVLDEVYGLDAARCGLLATLLLRGPQTVGELRARSERLIELPSVGAVQAELAVLAEHPEGLVRVLPRRPGQKEDRWQQIAAAPWTGAPGPAGGDEGSRPQADGTHDGGIRAGGPTDPRREHDRRGEDEPASSIGPGLASPSVRPDELGVLRDEVASLREAVSALREDLEDLRRGLGG